jgi:hypothetical protein
MKFRLAASTRASFRAIKQRRYFRICMEGRKGSTPAEPNDHKDGFSTGGKSGNEDGIFHNKMTEVFPELNRPQKQKISYRR